MAAYTSEGLETHPVVEGSGNANGASEGLEVPPTGGAAEPPKTTGVLWPPR